MYSWFRSCSCDELLSWLHAPLFPGALIVYMTLMLTSVLIHLTWIHYHVACCLFGCCPLRPFPLQTSTISLASLVGAASMNNTFCLAIFLILVFVKRLAWEFTAETLSLVAVQWIVALFAQRTEYRLYHALLLASLYPLTIVSVVVLEYMGYN